MWLKKLFTPTSTHPIAYPLQPQPHPQPDQLKKFEQQDDTLISTIQIDIQPDIRYKQYKQIPHNSEIKFPLVALHETENILLHEVGLYYGKICEEDEWRPVNFMVTDRQILVSPNLLEPYGRKTLSYNSISLGSIEKAELMISKKKQPTKLKLQLKNLRELHIKCIIGDYVNRIHEILTHFAFVKGVNKFYAYRFGELNWHKEEEFKGWQLYNIKREFLRQGLLVCEQGALGLRYVDNSHGELSPTYPELLVVPAKITDSELKKCAQFRTKERFPALTYIMEYKTNKYSSLFRCSQNKVGLTSTRSKQDELMMQYIGQLSDSQSSKNCKIYDARGYYAALGNMLAGKGYEKPQFYTNCSIQWLNIPNIHAVRDSFNAMMNYRGQVANFYTLCAQTGWYDYLYLIIGGAKAIARDLLEGVNVVVHCSDGWDRTSQLCALAQLILDPYYRTIQGFAVLIEKDWRHFGHKFRQRTGQYNAAQYHPYEKSPVFIQFLDCVYQITQQFPLSFEYSQTLLHFLAQQVDSTVYGTFLASNLQQSNQLQLQQKTLSIWSHILENSAIYKNPFYEPELNEFWLNVGTEPKCMTVWRRLFLGDGGDGYANLQIMRHEIDRNCILKGRFYQNQKEIEELKRKLEEGAK